MAARPKGRVSLIAPRKELEPSYRSLIEEITSRGERLVPFTLGFEYEKFDDLLKELDDNSKGIGLPKGFVAHSSFWLVRDKSEIVGVSNLRHELTPALRIEGGHIGYGIRPSLRRKGFGSQILRETLSRARSRGLNRILLTCGKENIASVKIILANGGVLDSEAFHAPRNEIIQRYWIDLGATAT
ncbi:MAG: GNAT family N-acetyltransferase [Burkholderiales bacterium]